MVKGMEGKWERARAMLQNYGVKEFDFTVRDCTLLWASTRKTTPAKIAFRYLQELAESILDDAREKAEA